MYKNFYDISVMATENCSYCLPTGSEEFWCKGFENGRLRNEITDLISKCGPVLPKQ